MMLFPLGFHHLSLSHWNTAYLNFWNVSNLCQFKYILTKLSSSLEKSQYMLFMLNNGVCWIVKLTIDIQGPKEISKGKSFCDGIAHLVQETTKLLRCQLNTGERLNQFCRFIAQNYFLCQNKSFIVTMWNLSSTVLLRDLAYICAFSQTKHSERIGRGS